MAESTGSHEMKPVRCGCGGEAELCRGTTNPPYYWVQCSVCGTGTIGNMKLDPDESVAIWNRAMGERTVKAEHVRLEEDVTFGNLTFRKGTGVLHKCTACGYWVKPGDKYCVNCGARLEWE